MKTIGKLKVGDQVPHGTYGNVLTITVVEKTESGVRIVYQAKDGSKIENTYRGRTLNMKVKVI